MQCFFQQTDAETKLFQSKVPQPLPSCDVGNTNEGEDTI